jgi:arylformamidase
MKKIYDLSVTITPSLAVWPGDTPIYLERESKIEEGANSNVSRMNISVHTGTHVDAPRHFVQEAKTIEAIPVDTLVGEAQVIEMPQDVSLITAKELKAAGIKPGIERLIIKTRNSQFFPAQSEVFHTHYAGIGAEGADWLVKAGVKLVGTDYLSIAPYKATRPTHEVFLKAEVVLVEGLVLQDVSPGFYLLCCLPLKLGGSDGAPARVVLIEE